MKGFWESLSVSQQPPSFSMSTLKPFLLLGLIMLLQLLLFPIQSFPLLQEGAKALIGLPVNRRGAVVFNSDRLYGRSQLAQLFANWKQVYTEADLDSDGHVGCYWCYQPLFLVEK